MREFLTDDGMIYVHIGPNAAHYARVILDEVFGSNRLFADIVWKRTTQHGNASKKPGYVHDRILSYSKTEDYKYHEYFHAHDPKYIETFFKHSDERGRYRIADLSNPDFRPNLMYEYKGYKPPKKGWAVSLARMEQMDADGLLYFPKDSDGRCANPS